MKGREDSTGQDLYPPIQPYESGFLEVGDGHRIYWEVSGNPAGAPALFLHGGPGTGASPDHRRFFDPEHYRIVVFDQRGAGRSEPFGSVAANGTEQLVADIERLRDHLDIAQWLVFGGSWGSTLALAYAQFHPAAVSALVLRGIFLCRQAEIDWWIQGMRQFFPEEWDRFASHIPANERGDLLAAYFQRLIDPDAAVHMPAARVWSGYEGACSTLLPGDGAQAAFANPKTALGVARIEAHYFLNHRFFLENPILGRIDAIRAIPAVIIQGRYDVVCPPVTAMELHRAWPEADFQMIPDAGHSAMEPGIRRALVAATDRFRGQ